MTPGVVGRPVKLGFGDGQYAELGRVGLSEDEFYDIATSHTISPWQFDRSKIKSGKKTHDFDKWQKYGAMPRKEAEEQLIKIKDIT